MSSHKASGLAFSHSSPPPAVAPWPGLLLCYEMIVEVDRNQAISTVRQGKYDLVWPQPGLWNSGHHFRRICIRWTFPSRAFWRQVHVSCTFHENLAAPRVPSSNSALVYRGMPGKYLMPLQPPPAAGRRRCRLLDWIEPRPTILAWQIIPFYGHKSINLGLFYPDQKFLK
jgi:hypothetical protein